jgi:hypothetical protein
MDDALGRIANVTSHQHYCGSCGDEFDPEEVVVLLQVVRPYRYQDSNQGWQLHFQNQLTEYGEFIHYPYFFHRGCWEEVLDSIEEAVCGEVPTPPDNYTACLCDTCKSSISDGELIGIAHSGVFLLSNRQPNLIDALEHSMSSQPIYLCTQCLCELNLNILEGLWPEDEDIMGPGPEDDEDYTDEDPASGSLG